MAKIIKITPEFRANLIREFAESVAKMKLDDGKLNFSKSFANVDSKANIIFKESAWLKMQALINNYDSEIGWHGVAKRGDDNTYIIEDILVYPQQVTGATVDTDSKEYSAWLMSQSDEVFNNLRMQGHSHVNMSVTPSSTDLELYRDLLAQLDDTMFYIFMIYNKRGECTVKVYDLAKNILFEKDDCTITIEESGIGVSKLLEEASKLVTRRSYTYTTPKSDSTKKETVATNKSASTKEPDVPWNKKYKSYGYEGYWDDYDKEWTSYWR